MGFFFCLKCGVGTVLKCFFFLREGKWTVTFGNRDFYFRGGVVFILLAMGIFLAMGRRNVGFERGNFYVKQYK